MLVEFQNCEFNHAPIFLHQCLLIFLNSRSTSSCVVVYKQSGATCLWTWRRPLKYGRIMQLLKLELNFLWALEVHKVVVGNHRPALFGPERRLLFYFKLSERAIKNERKELYTPLYEKYTKQNQNTPMWDYFWAALAPKDFAPTPHPTN